MLIISSLVSGFTRSSFIIPYLVVSQYFDAGGEDKTLMEFWFNCTSLGDVFALLGMSLLLKYFNWKVSFAISIVIVLLLAVGMFLLTDEVRMEEAR